MGQRLFLIALIGAWVFVVGSLIGFNAGDPPTHLVSPANNPVKNWCGGVGAWTAYHMIWVLGAGAYVLVGVVGIGLFWALVSEPGRGFWREIANVAVRALGLSLMVAAVASAQALLFPSSGPFPGLAGGKVGVVAMAELVQRFGTLGSGIIAMLALIVGAVVCLDQWIIALASWGWRVTRERGAPALAAGASTAGTMGVRAGAVAINAGGRSAGGLWKGFTSLFAGRKSRSPLLVRTDDLDDQRSLANGVGAPTRRRRGKSLDDLVSTIQGTDEVDEEETLDRDEIGEARVPHDLREVSVMADDSDEESHDDADGAEEASSDTAPAAKGTTTEELRAKIAKLPVVFGQKDKQIATDADLSGLRSQDGSEEEAGEQNAPAAAMAQRAQDENATPVPPAPPPKPYQFPGLDLLENPEENFNLKLEEYVREQAAALESALEQYRIDGNVVGIESGPVITLFDVRLAPGTKVAQIQAVSSDIARALKAINIRIVPNQAGRDTIGIEVPNAHKEKVRLKELMSQTDLTEKMRLPMFLGKDASGQPLIADLTQMPHMLIAGTTGSGKSVCMNTIIMSFLYTKKPSELKLVLVDPKMVEMSQFRDIPHLMCPVVTEMGKAAAILEWATVKMDERYELLAEAGCRDIASYNDLPFDELKERLGVTTPEQEAKVPRKLPYMVFIIDELADLMMTAKEVESHIIRIAQKARAVGIHLILATQRPQANVVTGLIKANMPCRIAFKVASGMDSRIVLDQKGGELLLGHGDMLFLSPRSSKLTRSQGTLVDDLEIRRVVRFMRDIAGPSFERQLLQIRRSEDGSGLGNLNDEDRILQSQNNSSASLAAAQEDPLFPRAVEIVLETRRGSVSLLQRRLAIGYTRASRLIDLMGIAGIISDHKGSVARDVLITIDDWETMKRLAKEQGGSLEADGPDKNARLFDDSSSGSDDAEAAMEDDSVEDEEEVEATIDDEHESAEIEDTDDSGSDDGDEESEEDADEEDGPEFVSEDEEYEYGEEEEETPLGRDRE
ncbi:MAG: DNA translocase FtsK 4TM domain-containing protein [Phycisphaerales bacterium]|nr:MAG: DNA translocase FtsK 4TM domain-containing protein [Phycisphaerales bacterium]